MTEQFFAVKLFINKDINKDLSRCFSGTLIFKTRKGNC